MIKCRLPLSAATQALVLSKQFFCITNSGIDLKRCSTCLDVCRATVHCLSGSWYVRASMLTPVLGTHQRSHHALHVLQCEVLQCRHRCLGHIKGLVSCILRTSVFAIQTMAKVVVAFFGINYVLTLMRTRVSKRHIARIQHQMQARSASFAPLMFGWQTQMELMKACKSCDDSNWCDHRSGCEGLHEFDAME